MNHEYYMSLALQQAQLAMDIDEVPIGAVVVYHGEVIGRGYNTRNSTRDATAHAEMIAIREACQHIGDWRLNQCDIYVTLQPCMMCLGACYNARLDNIYYGAYDSNQGSANIDDKTFNTLNHTLCITGGILQSECSNMLIDYFASKRTRK